MVDLGHDMCLEPALEDVRVLSDLLMQNEYFFRDWGQRE